MAQRIPPTDLLGNSPAGPPTSGVSRPRPPEGFESWLEYAILTFSEHWVALDYMFDDKPIERHEIETAVLEEFNLLRARASLPPLDPTSRRRRS